MPDEKRRVDVEIGVQEGSQFLIGSVKLRGLEPVLKRKVRNVGKPYLEKPVNVACVLITL